MDKIILTKEKPQPYLDNEFLASLNYYFGDLCNDENYVKAVPLKENPETHPPPELQEFDVMMALSKIKKTATGPDQLPFWVWRDNCTTLAPVVTALGTSLCPLTHGRQLGQKLTSTPFQR